jgi:MscS family membrane protein
LPIVSFTRRDQVLIQTVLGLRSETTLEQLRYVLDNLRRLLKGDPRLDPDLARARLGKFGDSSLDIEAFAHARTAVWTEFLVIREELLLRMLDIIEQAGTEMAFPSQTLYLWRDGGIDSIMPKAAAVNAEGKQSPG